MHRNDMPGPGGGKTTAARRQSHKRNYNRARSDRQKRKLQSEKEKKGRKARGCVRTVRDNRAVLGPHVP
jgi:predicted kinase